MDELLIQAYEEFIKILGDEIDELAPMAFNHGWRSSRVEEGKKAREKIRLIKELLEEQKLLKSLNNVVKEHYPTGFPESTKDEPSDRTNL